MNYGLTEIFNGPLADFTFKKSKFYKETKIQKNQIISLINNNPLINK